jgi:hypothetical protein
MTIDDLYSLIEDIQSEEKYLILLNDTPLKLESNICVDILQWEYPENIIDGGWFASIDAAYKFCLEYQTSPVLRPLIAVSVESDQHGTFYLYPEIITSYQEAVEYELKISTFPSSFDLFPEYVIFPKGTNLEEVLKDLKEHEAYSSDYEDYYDIEEVQQYYGVQEATYPDGTIAVIGDAVIVNSEDFAWGILNKKEYTGIVTLLDDPRYIQLKLDNYEREIRLTHYLVKKYE